MIKYESDEYSHGTLSIDVDITELILNLHPANERRRYFATTYLIGWVQT